MNSIDGFGAGDSDFRVVSIDIVEAMGQPETDSGETGWQETGLWYKLREILTMRGEGPIEGVRGAAGGGRVGPQTGEGGGRGSVVLKRAHWI